MYQIHALIEEFVLNSSHLYLDVHVKLDFLVLLVEQQLMVNQLFFLFLKLKILQRSFLIACGGLRNSPSGTIKYPPAESKYDHNAKCAWLIKTNITQVLNITFTKFEIEYSRECRFDWLQIHDGRSSASYMIGK